jgi:hypothetical protein
LTSRVAKRANVIQKTIFHKCNMGSKNAEFDAEFESVEKVAKKVISDK